MSAYKRINEKSATIFSSLVIFLSLLFYVINAFSDGATFRSVYEYAEASGGVNPGTADAFFDHTNSVTETYVNPYIDRASIYPPMAELCYEFFGETIPVNIREVDGRTYMHHMVGFILFNMMCIFVIICCIRRKMKNVEGALPNMVSAAFLLSAPLMYTLERGNILILAMMFSMLFYAYYDSPNKWQRELSYLCLALAFSIKIYPAIFGILLLKKHDWKGVVKTSVLGILSMTLPFCFFYEWTDFLYWISNLTATSSGALSWGYGYNVSLYAIIYSFAKFFKMEVSDSGFWMIKVVVELLLLISMFITKKEWKALMAAALLLILVPQMSWYYTVLFLWVPTLALITYMGEEERDKKIIVYVLLMCVFVPWALQPIPEYAGWLFQLSYSGLLYDLSLLLLVGAIVVMCFWERIHVAKTME